MADMECKKNPKDSLFEPIFLGFGPRGKVLTPTPGCYASGVSEDRLDLGIGGSPICQ